MNDLRVLSDTSDITAAFLDGLRPMRQIGLSEWANKNRWLTKQEGAAEHGKYTDARTPYVREIADTLTDRTTRKIVFMKSAQIGGTTVFDNWVGHTIDVDPCGMIVVQPNAGLGKRWSRLRLTNLLESTPCLRGKVAEAKSRDSQNTIDFKAFDGGYIYVAGAQSATALRSLTARKIALDEVDAYPGNVQEEGDAVALAENRANSFSDSKLYICSTPLIKDDSRIEYWFNKSDKRYYHVPCMHCGHYQRLVWAQVQWKSGKPQTAQYCCIKCGTLWAEHEKLEYLPLGKWVKTNPESEIAGFHISALYAPYGWEKVSLPRLAEEFLAAGKDPQKLQVFVNTKLGETFDEGDAYNLNVESLAQRAAAENWQVQQWPTGVEVVTVGVDVQQDRLECEIVGWGKGEESWSLGYHVISGTRSDVQTWNALEAFVHADRPVHVSAVCVDTGGFELQDVADWLYTKRKERVKWWGIRGDPTLGAIKTVWPKKPQRVKGGKIEVYTICVNAAKQTVYRRLRIDNAGPGYCHFPVDRDDTYYAGLTAEKVITTYHRGHPTKKWHLPAHRRNEPLDCRVYAYAALCGLQWKRIKVSAPESKAAATVDEAAATVDEAALTEAPAQAQSKTAVKPAAPALPVRPQAPLRIGGKSKRRFSR